VFYRYTQAGARIAVDLQDLYAGQTLFLIGGSPILSSLPMYLLRREGVISLGLNNVPLAHSSPHLWVGADKPECFSPHILLSPEIMKFAMISRRDLLVPGTETKLRQAPNMFFFSSKEKVFTYENYFKVDRDFAWWRSTFMIAIQLAYKLGFRRVCLVGCSMRMDTRGYQDLEGGQYAWETRLSADEAQYSQNSYTRDVGRMKELIPSMKKAGLKIVSCTPDSALHEVGFEFEPLSEAVAKVREALPRRARPEELKHSSAFKKVNKG